MTPDLDPTDGLPSRAALARELIRYKMEDYSENSFCASWLVDLEFELWEAADRDAPCGDEMFTVNTCRECRLLAELCGGWWAWDKAAPAGVNPVFMPMERWLEILADRGK
jgi:hypothetical protein